MDVQQFDRGVRVFDRLIALDCSCSIGAFLKRQDRVRFLVDLFQNRDGRPRAERSDEPKEAHARPAVRGLQPVRA
jgi:hypothetical protein